MGRENCVRVLVCVLAQKKERGGYVVVVVEESRSSTCRQEQSQHAPFKEKGGPPVVNYINIVRAAFAPIFFCQKVT